MSNQDSYVVLMSPNNIVRRHLEEVSKENNVEYRLSDFVISQEVDNGTLCYSSLTGSLILVRDFNKAKDFLISERILVKTDEEEKDFVDNLRKYYSTIPFEAKECNYYHILTTTGCNASCFYCYEKHYKKQTMNSATARKTAEYIIEHYTGKQVCLHWFGGEPLVNIKAIDIITGLLRKADIDFISEITTNGYLFTPKLFEKCTQLWNLRKAIITVDGTEDVYNTTKYYSAVGNTSPYQVVLTNIDRLATTGINIIIRTNIGPFNINCVRELYEELKVRYLAYENISVHPHIIANPPGNDIYLTQDDRRQIYNVISELKKPWNDRARIIRTIYELPGFTSGRGIEFTGERVVIKPDGTLALNPDMFDDECFGSITDGFQVDEGRLSQYLKKEETTICMKCPLYPSCFKREISFYTTVCTKVDYEKCIDNSIKSMLSIYQLIKDCI